jgi:hypothetical protein
MARKHRKSAPLQASISDVEKKMEEWTLGMQQCRTYGHRFDPMTARRSPQGTILVVRGCRRCKNSDGDMVTHQSEISGDTGRIIHAAIRYPKGYLMTGTGRVIGDAKDFVRLHTTLATFNKLGDK